MLSAICHLPCPFWLTYFLRLTPNATSALELKMVHTEPKSRYSEKMENGVLFSGAQGK
jgi:hypothetical protein